MNKSDIEHIKRSFDSIGAGFSYITRNLRQHLADYEAGLRGWSRRHRTRQEMENEAIRYRQSKDYAFKIIKKGKAEIFELTVKKEIEANLDVQLSNIDKHRKIIILTFLFQDHSEVFLCSNDGGKPVIRIVPAGTPGGIEAALNALNKAGEERPSKAPNDYEEDFKRDRNKSAVPSIEDIKNKIKINLFTRNDYEFYLSLLEKCGSRKILTDTRQVIPAYSGSEENTFPVALMRVAAFYSYKVREIDDWKPHSHNPVRQFSSLVRHLFAQYSVPLFMDSVWFRKGPEWIMWFIDLARGKSVRKLKNFPLTYTKKMWHTLLQAPGTLSIEQAIRWGQVMALGGNQRFFQEIENTRIETIGSNNPFGFLKRHAFWQTVIEWFLRHPMLDPAHYGPIVDFINHQKYHHPRENPDFQITGRSPGAVLALVDQWHGGLGKVNKDKLVRWNWHHLDWRWEQKKNDTVIHIWEMRELLNSHELLEEGKKMHHCVYTYTGSCVRGRSLIFSLRCDEYRVLTIEYLPQTGKFGEVRGVSNRRPTSHELGILKKWAAARNLQKALTDYRMS